MSRLHVRRVARRLERIRRMRCRTRPSPFVHTIPNAMKTQNEAISEGYSVDLSGPGRPMGARGKYPNFEVIPLLTDMEAELLNTLGLIRKLLTEGTPSQDAQEGVVLAIDGLLSVARA